MAESEEELKRHLMRVKEKSEKADLKHNIQKNNIMAFGPITSWQIERGKVDTMTDFMNIFFPFIFISWRLIILQCCSDFCHTLT